MSNSSISETLKNVYAEKIKDRLDNNSVVLRLLAKDKKDRQEFVVSGMTKIERFIFLKINIPPISRMIWNKYFIEEAYVGTGVEWSLYKKHNFVKKRWHNLGMPIKCGEHLIKTKVRDVGKTIGFNFEMPLHYGGDVKPN